MLRIELIDELMIIKPVFGNIIINKARKSYIFLLRMIIAVFIAIIDLKQI